MKDALPSRSDARPEAAPVRSVRKALPDDLIAILTIERQAFAVPWSAETLADEIAGKAWSRTMVAESEGRIVGFMIYWTVLNEVHILNLAVHPGCRRTGVASVLLAHLMTTAKREKIHDIFLEVRVSNRAARRLYRKHGFKPVAIRQQYYADNGEDAIVMCRRREP